MSAAALVGFIVLARPSPSVLRAGVMGAVALLAGALGRRAQSLPLLASAELIGRAQAIVTNDSAPQHLASAMGTPTVTVFGPTVPEFGFGKLVVSSALQVLPPSLDQVVARTPLARPSCK